MNDGGLSDSGLSDEQNAPSGENQLAQLTRLCLAAHDDRRLAPCREQAQVIRTLIESKVVERHGVPGGDYSSAGRLTAMMGATRRGT
ncbi:MAG: hypothetical protein WBQ66_00710, partial [Blastocatellia bacterium]